MSSKRRTRKTVTLDIERLQKHNADRAERIAKLQEEIEADNDKIKELETLRGTLHKEELQGKLSPVYGNKILTDEEILQFIEINKVLYDKIGSLDMNAVMSAITGGNVEPAEVIAPKKSPKVAPKAIAEPVIVDEPPVELPNELPDLQQIEPQDEV